MSVDDLTLPSPAQLDTEFPADAGYGITAFSTIEAVPDPEVDELCGS
jgi:hypothetical protein